jgi:hypothetical protein
VIVRCEDRRLIPNAARRENRRPDILRRTHNLSCKLECSIVPTRTGLRVTARRVRFDGPVQQLAGVGAEQQGYDKHDEAHAAASERDVAAANAPPVLHIAGWPKVVETHLLYRGCTTGPPPSNSSLL